MGPGSRHDTLDDHFGHHNWRKYVSLGKFCPFIIGLFTNLLSPSGTTLHSRLLLAVKEQKQQDQIFNEFTDSLREGGKVDIEQWTAMVLDWEQDPSKTNPYVSLITRKFSHLIRAYKYIYVPCSRCIPKWRQEPAFGTGEERSCGRCPTHPFNWTNRLHLNGFVDWRNTVRPFSVTR